MTQTGIAPDGPATTTQRPQPLRRPHSHAERTARGRLEAPSLREGCSVVDAGQPDNDQGSYDDLPHGVNRHRRVLEGRRTGSQEGPAPRKTEGPERLSAIG